MSGRQTVRATRLRRYVPSPERLDGAKFAQLGVEASGRARDRAFLAAAEAGWSMREIAAAVGVAASTVNRAVVRAEAVS